MRTSWLVVVMIRYKKVTNREALTLYVTMQCYVRLAPLRFIPVFDITLTRLPEEDNSPLNFLVYFRFDTLREAKWR